VQFEALIEGRQGSVDVAPRKVWATTAGDVRVAPAPVRGPNSLTDVDGTVKIAANKGDLLVTDDNGTVTLRGQQTTRDEQTDQSADTSTNQ